MSSAQRFFGRQLRSVLPTIKKFLSPFNTEETKTKLRKAKQRQKKHYCYMVICRFMQNESQRHNDKGRAKTSLKKYLPLTLLQGFEKVIQGLCVRGSWRPNRNCNILTPHSYGRQCCVFLVLQMLNRRPRGPLCWVMAFFTASYQHFLWTPIQQGPKPFRPGVAFPITSVSNWNSNCLDFCLD